jgi:hypothetical protein
MLATAAVAGRITDANTELDFDRNRIQGVHISDAVRKRLGLICLSA